MQTGTGLGLAIVNSIVRSSSVDGKVDVWSSENVGTEIKVTFTADMAEEKDLPPPLSELWKPSDVSSPPTVTLINFTGAHRGVELLRTVLTGYLSSWWHMTILPEESEPGDIIIVNEDPEPVAGALARKDIRRPFILLSSRRGNLYLMSIVNDFEDIGGFCRILYKPGGPSRLHATLQLCLRSIVIGQNSTVTTRNGELRLTRARKVVADGRINRNISPRRHYSDLLENPDARPMLGPRSYTFAGPTPGGELGTIPDVFCDPPRSPDSPCPTISIGTGGILLKSSVGTLAIEARARVLVVEDNHILRELL